MTENDDGLTPQQRYYRKNRKKLAAYDKAYRKKNKEKIEAYQKQYREDLKTS